MSKSPKEHAVRSAVTLLVFVLLLVPSVAQAAISFVGSASSGNNPNTDTTVSYSGISGLAAGDLVIVAASVGDDDGATFEIVNNTAGYTKMNQLFSNAPGTDEDAYLAYWYKFMDVVVDTQVVIEGNGTGGTDSSMEVAVMAFRGVDPVTPFDVASTSTTGVDSGDPDPPSIDHNNPAGVWIVIAGHTSHVAGGSCTFTFPTGYTTNAISSGQDDSGTDTTIGMGYRSSGVSDPENPGSMTHTGTGCGSAATNSWAAVTMALRPDTATVPSVTTGVAGNISPSSATLFGNITSDGGASLTEYGFATSTSATMSSDVSTSTVAGGSVGEYSRTLFLSAANTIYYYRAYAANSRGYGFGAIRSFNSGNITVTRKMRLFEGFRVRVIGNRIILNQK